MNACFCCVRFSFSIPSQEIGLGNVSEMTYFVWSGCKTLTQSIKKYSQSLCFDKNGGRKSVKMVVRMVVCVYVFCCFYAVKFICFYCFDIGYVIA